MVAEAVRLSFVPLETLTRSATPVTSFACTLADWEILRRSQPEDYDGHTAFDRMTPAARLAWLDAAAEFVSRNSKPVPRVPSAVKSVSPSKR